MTRTTIITGLALLGGLGLLLAGAWTFRVELLRGGLNAYLADEQITVTRLDDVRIGTRGAAVAQVELLLQGSGLRLVLNDIAAGYALRELLRDGRAQSLTIGSALLSREAPAADPDDPDTGILLSDVLQLLGEFPVTSIAVRAITIPDRREPLDFQLQQTAAELSLNLTSGDLRLQGSVVQADTTRLQLTLAAAALRVAEFSLLLQPTASGYLLTGTGHMAIDDFTALLGEPLLDLLALPVDAVRLDLELEAEFADAFLAAAPSRFRLGIVAGSTIALPAGLIDGLGNVTARFTDRATLDFPAGAALGTGKLPLHISGSWQAQPFDATAQLSMADCRLANLAGCSLAFQTAASLAAWSLPQAAASAPPVTITALQFTGSGTIAPGAEEGLQLTLDTDSRLASGTITTDAFAVAALSIVTAAPLTLQSNTEGSALTITGARLSGTVAGIAVDPWQASSDFHLQDVALNVAESVTGVFTLHTEGLLLSGPQSWLPGVDLAAAITLDDELLTFSTPLLLRGAAGDPGIVAAGTYALASGAAAMTLTVPPLVLDGAGKSLSAYMAGWPYPFDLMTGTLAADVALQWQPPAAQPATEILAEEGTLTATLSATLTDAAGYYDALFFRGLNTTLQASLDTSAALPVNTPPLTLTIADIDVGLPLSNINVTFRIDRDAQTLFIDNFSGELLGGTLSVAAVSYDFTRERNAINLRFTGLRLDRMLALAEYDGVEANGAVSGLLPLTVTASGVEVAAGTLFAEAPGGTIHYVGDATAGAGNLGLDLMNQALGNYQFESLESTIDYTPDGELLLAMKMQGHNPDMNDGQRINLNLNLSDNIPALLRSLQAGRAIQDFVEGQYQSDDSP
jgi:hypothetical protein